MNEQIANKLIQYLEGAESFISGQLPDFADQFVQYEIWSCQWVFYITLIMCIFFFICASASLITGLCKRDGTGAIWSLFLCGVVFLVFFGITVNNYRDLRMLEIAPKVYMVKQAKSLLIGPRK